MLLCNGLEGCWCAGDADVHGVGLWGCGEGASRLRLVGVWAQARAPPLPHLPPVLTKLVK